MDLPQLTRNMEYLEHGAGVVTVEVQEGHARIKRSAAARLFLLNIELRDDRSPLKPGKKKKQATPPGME